MAIRAVGGDPNGVWEEVGWADMSPEEQAAWSTLGWDEASWEEDTDPPLR
ncbi:MAG: hypothetical protein Fur0042_30290 [Cyanophyceae cyanobacterium]